MKTQSHPGDDESNELILHYYSNPHHNKALENFTIKQEEGNSVCGDDITVYLLIDSQKDTIIEYSFTGNTSMITSAAASFTAEIIVNQKCDDILTRKYETIKQNDFIVSPRRSRAAVIALLATRNAIHHYRQDGQHDTFEDLIIDL